jgi:hypothetical protein
VHPTLGILRKSQAVSYALAFFQLDGFAVPTPARVTQTVGTPLVKQKESLNHSFVLSSKFGNANSFLGGGFFSSRFCLSRQVESVFQVSSWHNLVIAHWLGCEVKESPSA